MPKLKKGKKGPKAKSMKRKELHQSVQSSSFSGDSTSYKICMVGPPCGKTSLLMRLINDYFDEEYDPTLEDNFKKSGFMVDGEPRLLDLLDTSGNDTYAGTHAYEKWFGGADGFVFVYSIASVDTFDIIPQLRKTVAEVKGTFELPIVLVGTQADLEDSREVTDKEGKSVAYTYHCPFIEASSKDDTGVTEVFEEIVREIDAWKKKEEMKELTDAKKGAGKGSAKVIDLTDATITGALQMKSTVKQFKSWKKYWFAINAGIVYIFLKEKDFEMRTPAMAIDLLTCTVKPSMGMKGVKHAFEIIGLRDRWYFQAEDPQQMMEWMNGVQDGIAFKLEEQTADKSKLKTHGERGNLVVWEELKEDPANCVCADCRSPNPDWLSINLGILICIQCSGVHRSMGVHISKVRSITLDELEQEELGLLTTLGNVKTNRIWEKNLEALGVSRPEPTDDRGTKETFIKLKYVERKFIDEDADSQRQRLALLEGAREGDLHAILRVVAVSGYEHMGWQYPEEDLCTALHIAAGAGQSLASVLLILNGADPNAADGKGRTPLQLAHAAHFPACVDSLARHGAKGVENLVAVEERPSEEEGAADAEDAKVMSESTSPREDRAEDEGASESGKADDEGYAVDPTLPAPRLSGIGSPPLQPRAARAGLPGAAEADPNLLNRRISRIETPPVPPKSRRAAPYVPDSDVSATADTGACAEASPFDEAASPRDPPFLPPAPAPVGNSEPCETAPQSSDSDSLILSSSEGSSDTEKDEDGQNDQRTFTSLSPARATPPKKTPPTVPPSKVPRKTPPSRPPPLSPPYHGDGGLAGRGGGRARGGGNLRGRGRVNVRGGGSLRGRPGRGRGAQTAIPGRGGRGALGRRTARSPGSAVRTRPPSSHSLGQRRDALLAARSFLGSGGGDRAS